MANRKLLTTILSSIFFRNSTKKAARYARSSKSLMALIQQVADKTKVLGVTGSYAVAKDQINLLVRMVRAYAKGEYRALPGKTLLRLVAVLVYFVSPIDVLPDFLPIIGMADDIALLMWLISAIGDDIEKFSQWEKDRTAIKVG